MVDGSALVFAVADASERSERLRARLADGAIAPEHSQAVSGGKAGSSPATRVSMGSAKRELDGAPESRHQRST
jgi:hypothetical protein